MTEGSTHQEDETILNVCAPNSRLFKYMKQSDRTARRDKEAMLHFIYYVWRPQHPLSVTDQSTGTQSQGCTVN